MRNIRLRGILATCLQMMLVGCGQGAPTCDSICNVAPATSSQFNSFQGEQETGCVSACTGKEQACEADGHAADFQAYLTCVDNAGGFSSGPRWTRTRTPIAQLFDDVRRGSRRRRRVQ